MSSKKRSAGDIALAMLGGTPQVAKAAKPAKAARPAKAAKAAKAATKATKATKAAKAAKTTKARTDAPDPAVPAAPPSITPLLERAAAGKEPLEALLEAWRLVPAPEIAEAIESVPREDLAEVTTGTAVEGLARLSRLDTARDPRVAAALVRWLADPPWHATGSKPFYTALFRRLRELADPRAAATLPKAAKAVAKVVNGKSMRGWLVEQIEKAAAETPGKPPALSSKDSGLVARAAKAVAKAPRSAPKVSQATAAAAELLAAIRADPKDDGARQVYADVLAAKNDPRGEFITMQLARAGREPTPEERKREIAILRKHVRVWLGELAAVGGRLMDWNLAVGIETDSWDIRFERGFLASIGLRGSEKKMTAVAGHPELATVEELLVAEHGKAILEAGTFPALTFLAINHDVVAIALKRPFAKQLERLAIAFGTDLGSTYVETIASVASLPKLRRLDIDVPSTDVDELVANCIRAALAIPQLEKIHVELYNGTGFYKRSGGKWTFTKGEYAPKPKTLKALTALA